MDNNAVGILFNGCMFGSLTIDATNGINARILNSSFANMDSSNITNVSLVNCTKIDGTPVS